MSSTDDLDDFYGQTVAVRTHLGSNGAGAVLDDPVDVACLVIDKIQTVRGADGQEVTSTGQLSTRPENAALFTPNSVVNLGTRSAFVISTSTSQPGLLDLPAHCRVNLT